MPLAAPLSIASVVVLPVATLTRRFWPAGERARIQEKSLLALAVIVVADAVRFSRDRQAQNRREHAKGNVPAGMIAVAIFVTFVAFVAIFVVRRVAVDIAPAVDARALFGVAR